MDRREDQQPAAATLEFTLQNRSGSAKLIKSVRHESRDAAGKWFLLPDLRELAPIFSTALGQHFFPSNSRVIGKQFVALRRPAVIKTLPLALVGVFLSCFRERGRRHVILEENCDS